MVADIAHQDGYRPVVGMVPKVLVPVTPVPGVRRQNSCFAGPETSTRDRAYHRAGSSALTRHQHVDARAENGDFRAVPCELTNGGHPLLLRRIKGDLEAGAVQFPSARRSVGDAKCLKPGCILTKLLIWGLRGNSPCRCRVASAFS
jgi:hypothetical protein